MLPYYLVTTALFYAVQESLVRLAKSSFKKDFTLNTPIHDLVIPKLTLQDKHMPYIVCNLFKAFVLLIIVVSPAWWRITIEMVTSYSIGPEFLDDLLYMGFLYGPTDGSAMLVNYKHIDGLSVIHHCITFGAGLIFSFFYPSTRLIKNFSLMIWFGTLSVPTYLVNFYLGARKVPQIKNSKVWGPLVKISFLIYVVCCAVNWVVIPFIIWHLEVKNEHKVAYALIIGILIRADWVLLKSIFATSKDIVHPQERNDERGGTQPGPESKPH